MSDTDDARTPDTYTKALGHDVLLNTDAEIAPNHNDDRSAGVTVSWYDIELGVFLPRETGTYHEFQTDGMLMKHPCLEGTVVPLRPWNSDPSHLPEANYMQWDNQERMEMIWADICDDIGIVVDDVPAPDGYAQTQEGIRWVTVTDHDLARENEFVDTYIPTYNDWIRWHESTGTPVALVYRNCD